MPKLRVFVTTYRRPHLLPRALASLRAQTFTDWICEVHNDAPDDPEPGRIVEALGDPRFFFFAHGTNWGPTRVFNHVFEGGAEPLASLLEDDNWWEPRFLEAAIEVIERHPEASIVWGNMRVWRENETGDWTDTGKTIWPIPRPGTPPVVFRMPEIVQSCGALHSQGAMVFRPSLFRDRRVPGDTPVAIIEAMRERAATGPLVLLPEPLAHFSLTRSSARAAGRVQWLQSELIVATSFFARFQVEDGNLVRLWAMHRGRTPKSTPALFFAAAALRSVRLLRPARLADWLWFAMGTIRHPGAVWGGFRFRGDHRELVTWLRTLSSEGGIAQASVLEKADFRYST